MAEIVWNRLNIIDWMAMAGAVSALVYSKSAISPTPYIIKWDMYTKKKCALSDSSFRNFQIGFWYKFNTNSFKIWKYTINNQKKNASLSECHVSQIRPMGALKTFKFSALIFPEAIANAGIQPLS